MKELVSYQEALELVLQAAVECGVESVPLDQSRGRITAGNIVARDSIPPFDNSAMDGYALQASDVSETPTTLRLVDEIPAGSIPRVAVASGTCSKIMTGAVVPDGADAVVAVEYTDLSGDQVSIHTPVATGMNIRKAGGDITAGTIAVEKGTVITPATIGMLAAIGIDPVSASVMPRVAIVATGDELIDPAQELSPGKIRNSNGPALAAQVKAIGARVVGPFVARDSRQSVKEILDKTNIADIIVFAGGVSVGEFDFVQEALEQRGMKTVFWRVRQRPGKPLLFGNLNGVPVFGLPGNPVSASVCFEAYVRPLIERSVGKINRATITARLGETVKKKPGLHYFSRGMLSLSQSGLVVNLAGPQASNVFSTMARADCLVHLTELAETIEEGELVEITPLPWWSM